ncbi:hypothetical protein [Crossiella sp. NPDC003009]
MRQGRFRLGRGPAAATSIVIGAAASAGINIATNSPGWAIITGVALVVLVWAGLEWWRASGKETEARVRVDQRAERVSGEVVGASGLPAGAGLTVSQEITEVGEGGSVTGYHEPRR